MCEEVKVDKLDILFLAKYKPFSEDAAELIKLHFPSSEVVFGNIGDSFPTYLINKSFDYVISYISTWIVPKEVLENKKLAAINFHPGPPEYPGIGCTNFAIYNNEKEFGITVHHMREIVDSGDIIYVKRFPIFGNDTVYSLTQRCYTYIYTAFTELFNMILADKPLPHSTERWKRKAFTRKELKDLCVITKDMSEEEVRRRLKATTFPKMPGAYIDLYGHRFEYKDE